MLMLMLMLMLLHSCTMHSCTMHLCYHLDTVVPCPDNLQSAGEDCATVTQCGA